MSMEQAILEHAAALRELSASIKAMYAGRADALALPVAAGGMKPDAELAAVLGSSIGPGGCDAELEDAVSKVEKDTAQAAHDKALDAALEKSKEEVATPLVYTTDVKPTLLKLNKEKGREALAGLLKKYNAPNGDKIKQDDLPLILADAEALLAAAAGATTKSVWQPDHG